MTTDHAILRQQWLALLPERTRGNAHAVSVINELIAAYTGDGRHYHTHEHIESMLAYANYEANSFEDLPAVRLAILFHDAVYDPRSTRNEQASADIARDRLTLLGCGSECVAKVAAFIEATAHSDGQAEARPDLQRLLDLDLSILAANARVYDRYASAIRVEYSHVADDDYRVGRTKVLRSFLARSRIFLCDDHLAAWEESARGNLEREIANLQAKMG